MSQDREVAIKLLEANKRLKQRKIDQFRPYDWQREFYAAGARCPERMLRAANRVGKTSGAAVEVSYHMTGRYPEWWQGRRFKHPVDVWTGSPTTETSRDIVQEELLGPVSQNSLGLMGTGAIPKKYIIGKPTFRQSNVSGVVDGFQVMHVSGSISTCALKNYEQGWQKWQGTSKHVIWLDEEPIRGVVPTDEDYKIFTEGETRIFDCDGILLVTFTPLNGETKLVQHFDSTKEGVFVMNVTWDDAPHLTEAAKASLRARYPKHEIDARTKGIPMLGSGGVFATSEEDIKCEPFEIPRHFSQIAGIDFGIDHPFGYGRLAFDRDKDIIYVTDVFGMSDKTALQHSESIKRRGEWLPIAWPHDGINRESGGEHLWLKYKKHGVNMLTKSACYDPKPGEREKFGRQPVEPVVLECLERIETGRLKVFSNCDAFFKEYRNYHRKNGKIVPRNDDVLKAVFYAMMMIRYACVKPVFRPRQSSAPLMTVRI